MVVRSSGHAKAPTPRVAVAVAALLLGLLTVLAATQPRRASRDIRRLELVDLIRAEDQRVRRLRAAVTDLRAEVAALEGTQGVGLRDLREEVQTLAVRAGGAALEGPGVTVTLDDSSSRRSPTGDPNDLIVHEQDIQTVVNALWAAGAEAVAVNGERLTSTSAVRCAGNTLLLHGALHSPPYRIQAIGDPQELAELVSQPGMDDLVAAADAFGLGFEVQPDTVTIASGPPAAELNLATPI
ncbi:MAG TPA: DUF881 domain-containing protein [Actinomycetota bacterium]|nr:DUF881 domain-containing protein [Actinomycetota bacterium]